MLPVCKLWNEKNLKLHGEINVNDTALTGVHFVMKKIQTYKVKGETTSRDVRVLSRKICNWSTIIHKFSTYDNQDS